VSWGEVTLGSIGEFKAGYGFPNSLQGKEVGDYPFAKVGDTSSVARSGEKYISSARNFLDKDELSLIKAKTVPVGSILFAKIGEAISQNFRVVTAVEMLIDNNTMGLLPDVSKINVDYLYYFMCGLDLYRYAGATTVPALRKSVLEEIKIPLPYPDDQEKSLKEQKRIAAILDKADGIRRKRQQATQLADDFLRSVFLDMFGDPVTNSKGWKRCKLEDLTSLVTYGLTVRPEYHDEGIPLISAREIRSGELNFDTCPRISKEDFEKLSEKGCPKKGDILFSKTGSIGHCALVEIDRNFAATQNVARIVVNQKICMPVFLLALLRTKYFYDLANREAKGNAVKDLQLGTMKSFSVYCPPKSVQEKFIGIYDKQLNILSDFGEFGDQDLFKSLSQKAFSGKL